MSLVSAEPAGPQHFCGLDAATIKTEQYLLTERAVRDCARFNTLALITGPAGRGKTFAVAAATGKLEAPVTKTLLGASTFRKELARALIRASTGTRPPPGRSHEQLVDECVEIFSTSRVAVIDEAQHLNSDCNFFLRMLLDHPGVQVSFVLVGAGGCRARIERDEMLASRIYRAVEFGDVPIEQILRALPNYHRVYADADPDLLREVARRFPIEQHRALAKLTHTFDDLCGAAGVDHIDREIAEQALGLVPQ